MYAKKLLPNPGVKDFDETWEDEGYLEKHVVLSNEMTRHGMQTATHQTTQRQVQQRLDAHEVQDGSIECHTEPNVDEICRGCSKHTSNH